MLAEGGDGLAGSGVEAVEEVHDAGKDAGLVAVGPVGDSAGGLRGGNAGVELPEELAGGGVEGDDLLVGRVGVEGAADDERVGLDVAFFAGVEGPGELKAVDVGAVDLGERGVVIAVGAAVVGGPAHGLRGKGGTGEDGEEREGDEVAAEWDQQLSQEWDQGNAPGEHQPW